MMVNPNNKTLEKLTNKLIYNQPKLIDYDLRRLEQVLSLVGSPQKSIKNIIHVAGTNGKGSTIANLKALLMGHGFSVNSFTSPHLIKPTERINSNGHDISDKNLLEILLSIINIKRKIELSYFELLTCASFIAFSKIKSDFTILEVGLGGRKDATNIVSEPIACLITPISLDHKEFLGDTLSKIAYEKAGIIKYQTPVFLAKQTKKVLKIIKNEAEKFNCKVYESGKDWKIKRLSKKNFVEIQDNLFELDSKSLKGNYQLENSALALATLYYLNILKKNCSEKYLSKVSWPGRFQYLKRGPIHDMVTEANQRNRIILDGAHNPSGAKAVAKEIVINKWENTSLILAMQKNKDLIGFMKHFEGLIKEVYVIDTTEKAFFSYAEIRSNLFGMDFEIYKKRSVKAAIKTIVIKKSQVARSIIITGSLYFIGKILEGNS